MKKEHVNPFIKASIDVLAQTTGLLFSTRQPYIKDSPFNTDNILINLGITGSLKGSVVISMAENTAKDIASRMMMDMPVEELNDLAKSALCELGNMILGNVATLFFNEGTQIDITPPTLFRAEHVQISNINMVIICIPLETEKHRIVLDVAIKEAGSESFS